jgi:hypothetical protein
LFATARDAGVSTDDLKPFMANLLGRVVESSKTLTRAEAARVIEALEAKKATEKIDLGTGEVLEAELVDWPATKPVPA